MLKPNTTVNEKGEPKVHTRLGHSPCHWSSALTRLHRCTEAMHLPLDVIGIIATHLIDQGLYHTCASLNVASSATRHETLKPLYRVFASWASDLMRKQSAHWTTRIKIQFSDDTVPKVTRQLLDKQFALITASEAAKFIE